MAARHGRTFCGLALVALLACPGLVQGQSEPRLLSPPARPSAGAGGSITEPANTKPSLVSPPASAAPPSSTPAVNAPRDLTPAFTADNRSGLKITKGAGVLPNEHGQVWREYDISPYTGRVRDAAKPEQAVIDWVLRDTGTEVWFAEPLGILSANRTTLRVYHTPEMQQQVREVVERLVATGAESHTLGVKLATVGSPTGTLAMRLLTTIPGAKWVSPIA